MRFQISKPMPFRNWLSINRDPFKYSLFSTRSALVSDISKLAFSSLSFKGDWLQIKLNQKVIILLLSYTRSDSYKNMCLNTQKQAFCWDGSFEYPRNIAYNEIYHIRNQMFHIFYSTYADASMYQGSSCWGFTILLQLLKSKNSAFASSANMSKLLLLLRWFLAKMRRLWNKQTVPYYFPLLMTGLGEMCFPRGSTLPFGKVRIYGEIKTSFLGKVRIKTHRILWNFGHSCWKS